MDDSGVESFHVIEMDAILHGFNDPAPPDGRALPGAVTSSINSKQSAASAHLFADPSAADGRGHFREIRRARRPSS